MKFELVTAISAAPLSRGAVPKSIVFIPEGRSKITPSTHPEGVWINVPPEEGHAIAADLNNQLAMRRGENVTPWFDFEHTRKHPASGYPTSFRYEPGRGIVCDVDWSESGAAAIRGRDVRYFSPEFYVDDNGIPSGIPERGPVGGLVTEPAFRNIEPVAASQLVAAGASGMEALNRRADALVTAGSASTREDAVLAICRDDESAYQTYRESLGGGTCEQTQRNMVAARAEFDEECRKVVAAGRAKSEDDAMEIVARENYDLYERACSLGGTEHQQLVRAQAHVAASGGDESSAWDTIDRRAKALVTAGTARDHDQAVGIVCSEDPDLYAAYSRSLVSASAAAPGKVLLNAEEVAKQ